MDRMGEQKVKWGIVGCGVIHSSHADAIRLSGNAELVAVCDIVREKAETAAKKYGVSKVYTDYHAMFSDSDIECVSICTPSGLHGEMCMAAARAGKHILCEKPMEITAKKIDEVIECVEKSGIKMGCVFQRRCDQKFIEVKKAVDSGRFGKLLLADAYLKYYRSDEYYASGEWRGTWELDGGGALMNQGVHGIDLLTWFAGDVAGVFARCRTQARSIEVEDTAIASLQFVNGAVGNIEGTTSVYPAQDTRIELHFEKGSIIVGDAGITQWSILGSDEKAPVLHEPEFGTKDDPANLPVTSHVVPVRDMADAVLYGHDPAVTPREARKAVDLILAIYRSSREQREIIL